jgi:hypothetical protein
VRADPVRVGVHARTAWSGLQNDVRQSCAPPQIRGRPGHARVGVVLRASDHCRRLECQPTAVARVCAASQSLARGSPSRSIRTSSSTFNTGVRTLQSTSPRMISPRHGTSAVRRNDCSDRRRDECAANVGCRSCEYVARTAAGGCQLHQSSVCKSRLVVSPETIQRRVVRRRCACATM